MVLGMEVMEHITVKQFWTHEISFSFSSPKCFHFPAVGVITYLYMCSWILSLECIVRIILTHCTSSCPISGFRVHNTRDPQYTLFSHLSSRNNGRKYQFRDYASNC